MAAAYDYIRADERLLDALLAGDAAAAERTLRGFDQLGAQVDVIQPALEQLGELCACGQASAAEERRATAIVERLLPRRLAAAAPGSRERVVLACVEGEHHALGLRMTADVLGDAGFSVDYLGASVPLEALLRLVEDEAAPLVGLSVSLSAGVPALLRTGRALAAMEHPPRLFLGGGGVPESLRRLRDVPYARTTRDAVRAVERALASRPPRPDLFSANHPRRRRADLALVDLSARRDDEYRRLALADAITGVWNRRAFEERAAELAGTDATLLVFDLDEFGLLEEGDRVLRAVADAAAGVIRGDDDLYRLGGDEFALLLPGTRPEDVESLVERLRGALARLSPPLTASFGVAPLAGDPRRALFHATALVLDAKARRD